MIIAATAARADVAAHHSAPTTHLSAALASSLSLPQQQVAKEAPGLRSTLTMERRQDRLAQQSHRAWSGRHRIAEGQAATPRTTAPSASAVASTPVVSHAGADWYAIAACESGGAWSVNSGNGYWGGLQFSSSTWFAYGGGPFSGEGLFPYSAGQQIAVAERILAAQGPSAWPNCFRWG